MKRHVRLGLLVGLVALPFTAVEAATISFTQTAIATGMLGTFSFDNQLITLRGTADTANIQAVTPLIDEVDGVSLFLDIGNVSTQFTDQTSLTSNRRRDRIGVGDVDLNAAILFTNLAPFTYDLTTSFGPATGTGLINAGQAFATTAGAFVLTSVGTSTFTATVGVPEPATWGLMISGLAMTGFVMRRRRTVVAA